MLESNMNIIMINKLGASVKKMHYIILEKYCIIVMCKMWNGRCKMWVDKCGKWNVFVL